MSCTYSMQLLNLSVQSKNDEKEVTKNRGTLNFTKNWNSYFGMESRKRLKNSTFFCNRWKGYSN